MDESLQTYRWKDIEIFGIIIPDFANHMHSIFVPLSIFHVACLFAFAGSLIFTLMKSMKTNESLPQKIFSFILIPSAILSILSGSYLFFVQYIMSSGNVYLYYLVMLYFVMAILYAFSIFYMIKTYKNQSVNRIKSYALSLGIMISTLSIVVLIFGDFYV